MKIYIDEAEIGSTISYKEENGKIQNLYVHDKEGFLFESLKEKLAEKDKEIEMLTNLINNTRKILNNVLMVNQCPVKGTTRKDCYTVLEKLQKLLKTNMCFSTEYFLDQIRGEK